MHHRVSSHGMGSRIFQRYLCNSFPRCSRSFIRISNAGLEDFGCELHERVSSAAIVHVRPDESSSRVITLTADVDFDTKKNDLKEQTIGKWLNILKLHSLSSEVGCQILSTRNVEKTQGAKEVVSSVLGVRSALLEYTITRANSLLRYFPWVA